jgi:acetyl-CoA acetyltransferase
VRTAIGTYAGTLTGLAAVDIGAMAIRTTLEHATLD